MTIKTHKEFEKRVELFLNLYEHTTMDYNQYLEFEKWIKQLVIDLIGEDENWDKDSFYEEEYISHRNELRAELRKIVGGKE